MRETRPQQKNETGSDIAAAVTQVQAAHRDLFGRDLTEEEMTLTRAALHRGVVLGHDFGRKQPEPHGYAACEGAEEDRDDGEAGVVRLPAAGIIGGPAHVNDREPNYAQAGWFYLLSCYACDPDGRKNLSHAVKFGTCAHCGWSVGSDPTPPAAGKAA